MTREEAHKLAQEEIDICKSENRFLRMWIEDLYESEQALQYCIRDHEDVILEIFTNAFLVKNSSLMRELEELD